MTNAGRLCRAALLCLPLAALPVAGALAQAPVKPGLGLCPAGANRIDAYIKALCEGESSLQGGDLGAATDRFQAAAALPRPDASNELAWAGLAVARCRAGDFEAGRQWAAHFAQARRLWLGELDCAAAADDPRARISPFVRSRMCTDRLAADYAAVRADPHSPHAADLRLRLAQIDERIAAACTTTAGAPAQAGATDDAGATKKSAANKRNSRSKKAPKNG